ncbi:MAG: MMPL family transporter [Deltaproteobacteria bacterium]|nr:MMPL family transporter [Deltaproteobacteria bacterium]
MENLLKKTSSLVFRFYKVILISASLLTFLSTLLIFRIDLKTDILDALPSKNPAIDVFVSFLNDFGSIDNLVIVLKSKDKKIDDYLEIAESLAKRLKGSPFIEYVDYNILHANRELMLKNLPLFLDKNSLDTLRKRLTKEGIEKQIKQNKRQLLSPLSTPLYSELILRDPLNLRSIVLSSMDKQGANRISIKQGYYISSDNSILLAFAKPLGSNRDIKFVKGLKKELDHIFEAVKKEYGENHDLQIGIAGPYAFAIEAHTTIQNDVVINAVTSTFLVFFLFQFVYKKRFLVLVITGTTLLTALSWSLGLAYLIFGSLNMTSSVVTAMLMGLGIDYIIHIFNRYETEFIQNGDLRHSLDTTLTKTAPGVVTGAVTTAAAFFSIVATSFKGLYQMGIVAGIGVLACLISTLLVMTSLIVFIERGKKGLLFHTQEQRLGIEGISKIIKNYPRPIIFASMLILLASCIGLYGIRFDNNPESIGPQTSQVLLLEKEIAEHFGKQKNPLIVTVTAENGERLMEQYSKLEAAIDRWHNMGIIAGHSSLRLFLPPIDKQKETIHALKGVRDSVNLNELEKIFKKTLRENGFIIDKQYAAYIKGIQKALEIKQPLGLEILANSSDKKVKYFYNSEKLKGAAYLYQKDGKWDNASIVLLQKEIEELGKGFAITGASIMFASLKASIIRESITASAIAFIMISCIICFQFRTVKRTFLVIIPLLIGLAITLGFMGLTGVKFNYINIGAVTLLFGIGVDYGVYIFQDYLEKKQSTPEMAIQHAGKAVIMCALTTIAGFGSLATMQFRGIASLGIIITIGVVACLISALFLLPVLIHYIEHKPS